ncbi:MAG: Fic family protein [Thiotrichaceae bacterium]|nr:Fic family protein [Thiotrichaceae bacterium]
MKIPVSPPDFDAIFRSITENDSETFLRLIQRSSPLDQKGRYLHWDKLCHLTPPEGLTSETWWFSIKVARRNLYKSLPLQVKQGAAIKFAVPDLVLRELYWLDRYAAGNIQSSDAITNAQTRNTYLIRSLIEEAINSSQLEGASTTRNVAREMIRQNRAPTDKSEQMILNNYHAMEFVREIKDEVLTPSIVCELHRRLTLNTLDENSIGRFRIASDEVHVVDNATQEYLHTPPPAEQLEERMQSLCDFANRGGEHDVGGASDNGFLHPVIRAITLHFMLAYDHPFCDGNGRTARALFYWAMAREGYWLMEFVSISRVIKKSPAQYSKAYLYTETDENDLTYFLVHQLEVIHQAVDALHEFLDQKMQGVQQAERMLMDNPRLSGKLNFRQLALLRHALKHPRFSYVIEEHKRSHGVSYDVARKDLLEMADKLKLLVKTKEGRRYYFVVPNDLEQRIATS